jgi:hypothetical protein
MVYKRAKTVCPKSRRGWLEMSWNNGSINKNRQAKKDTKLDLYIFNPNKYTKTNKLIPNITWTGYGELKINVEKPYKYFINGGCSKLYNVGSLPFAYK